MTVKQTFWSKVLWKAILFLGRMRLITLERAIKIVNHSLGNGAFRFKVNNGQWQDLNIDGEFVIDN